MYDHCTKWGLIHRTSLIVISFRDRYQIFFLWKLGDDVIGWTDSFFSISRALLLYNSVQRDISIKFQLLYYFINTLIADKELILYLRKDN